MDVRTILIHWRMSKRNSSIALKTALLFLLFAALLITIFAVVFSYHDVFDNTLGELLRIPALMIIGVFIFGAAGTSVLFLYRYISLRRGSVF